MTTFESKPNIRARLSMFMLALVAVIAVAGCGNTAHHPAHFTSSTTSKTVTLSEGDWARLLGISSFSSSEQDQRIQSAIKATQEPAPPPPTSPTYENFTAQNPPPATYRPFASTSPWNKSLAGLAVPLANSQEMVNYVLTLGSPAPGNMTSGGGYGHPVFFARTDSPEDVIELSGSGADNGNRIRVPAQAKPAPGTDAHMSVVQPNGRKDDFWQASPPSGGKLKARNGGIGNLTGDGTVPNIASTAGGFDSWAGAIRAPELTSATTTNFETINHALFLVIKTARKGHIPPAIHDDGGGPEEARVPYEGQRFELDLTKEQISALAVPPWEKAILSALSRYGAIDGDKGGPGFGFEFESSAMYTAYGLPDPFYEYGKAHGLPIWEGQYVYKLSTSPLTLSWWKEHLKAIKQI